MKLEDIPKKEIFNVPEGYFDGLPSKIQARIDAQKTGQQESFVFKYKLQYALPMVAILALGIFWFSQFSQTTDAESLLASVETEDLIAYLGESEITTDDVLNHVEFNSEDLEEIESEVYELQLDDELLDRDLNELDLENI